MYLVGSLWLKKRKSGSCNPHIKKNGENFQINSEFSPLKYLFQYLYNINDIISAIIQPGQTG